MSAANADNLDAAIDVKKKKIPFSVKFSIFIMLATGVIFLPATIVFCVCMIPTFVAAIVDNQPQKTMGITIGSLNMTGTIPAWFSLWQLGPTIPNALSLCIDPMTLLVAYAAAAVGWFVYHNITPLVASVMVKKNLGRVKSIETRQKELIRKWGEDVARGD